MSGLFGKSMTINNEQTRVGALRVQNSTQGIPVPIVYGKSRLTANLIDYEDFLAIPNTTTEESGKGGGGVTVTNTTYTYQVAIIEAVCEGPLPEWVFGGMVDKVWSNKDITTGEALQLVEFRGSYTQQPWSYMTSAHPTKARAYRGQAYIAAPTFQLGASPSLPNLSFEVRALLFTDDCEADVNCGSVTSDFLSNGNYGLGFQTIGNLINWFTYCDAAGFRVSPCYNAQRPAADMVDELCKISNSAVFWSEGLLKVTPYADQTVSRVPMTSTLANSLVETFPVGLANYVASGGGNAGDFTIISTPFGNGVRIAGLTGPGAPTEMTWSFFPPELNCSHVHCEFMLESANKADDAGSCVFLSQSNLQMVISPRREAALDAAQRPSIVFQGPRTPIAPAALPTDIWYSLDIDISLEGDNQTTYVLSYGQNGVVFNSGTLPDPHGGVIIANLQFAQDAFTASDTSVFANVRAWRGGPECVVSNTTYTYTPDLTVQYALSSANGDFISEAGQSPVRITRKRQADAYNVVQVSCLDRTNDYNKALVEASDLDMVERFGRRVAPVVQAEMICELEVARAVAQTALQRMVYLRNTYHFALGLRYSRLEPMDIVSLTEPNTQLSGRVVRITAVEEADYDGQGVLEMDAEDVIVGVGTPGSYQAQASSGFVTNSNADPGNANTPVIFQPPTELSGTPQVWIGASGGENWGGAEVWASDDGSTYARVGVIQSPARYGVVTANWPQSGDPDTTGNLSVSLANSGGTLSSGGVIDADAFGTLCWVGAANTPGELIAYTTATLTAPNAYDLTTYIRRGAFCTFIAAHTVGQQFLRVDGAVTKIAVEEARVGQTIHYKLRSFNLVGGGLQNLDSLASFDYVVQPIGIIVINGAVPSTIEVGQLLCIPEGAQYSVLQRMTNLGRINCHGRLFIQ